MIYKSNWSAWQRIDATICTHWHFLSLTQLALEHYQKVNTVCQYSDILSDISPLFWLKPWCLHCGSRWADSRGARQQAHSKRIWHNFRASFRLSPSNVMVSDQERLSQVMVSDQGRVSLLMVSDQGRVSPLMVSDQGRVS